jgi:hypothetical protein
MKLLRFVMAGLVASFLAGGQAVRAEDRTDVRELYGISWQPSLDSALKTAPKMHPAKPIFVLRTLGDLTGKT